MHKKLPEFCYARIPGGYEHQGQRGTIGIIRRGESGFYASVGMTVEAMIEKNATMGITPAQVEAMLCGSMFGWDVPGANPECYLNAKWGVH